MVDTAGLSRVSLSLGNPFYGVSFDPWLPVNLTNYVPEGEARNSVGSRCVNSVVCWPHTPRAYIHVHAYYYLSWLPSAFPLCLCSIPFDLQLRCFTQRSTPPPSVTPSHLHRGGCCRRKAARRVRRLLY